jgi:hypothetical protein
MLAKLAELLRGNYLKSVYHGEAGVRTLRELARSYLTTTKDLTRVMSRLKALYRSWAIPCAGRDVYYTRHRKLRRRETEVASRLSVSGESPFHLRRFFLGWWSIGS